MTVLAVLKAVKFLVLDGTWTATRATNQKSETVGLLHIAWAGSSEILGVGEAIAVEIAT